MNLDVGLEIALNMGMEGSKSTPLETFIGVIGVYFEVRGLF